MSQIKVLNIKGKEVDKIDLDKAVFDGKIADSLMHQAVNTYLANQRQGTACTKTRGEVRGGGRKPWRQKGTGRARVGSIRSPLWHGGGVTFGPKPRSYSKDLPKKMKTRALKSALNAKLRDSEIIVLDDMKVGSHKSKEFAGIVKKLKVDKEKVVFVVEKADDNIKLSSRNLAKSTVVNANDLTTYDLLACKRVVFTKKAMAMVSTRIKK